MAYRPLLKDGTKRVYELYEAVPPLQGRRRPDRTQQGHAQRSPESPAGRGPQNQGGIEMKKILVLNGPNINLLGIREKNIYGSTDYASLCRYIEDTAAKLGLDVEIKQSNSEGQLVTWIPGVLWHEGRHHPEPRRLHALQRGHPGRLEGV
jgi:hypothetical protein